VRQPSTYSLLGGLFSKEDLSSLFPGRLNKKESDERKKLAMALLDIMATIPRGHVRTAKIGQLREQFPAPVREREDDGNAVLRFDLKFPLPTPIDKPRELWFDHAIVQETCTTHAEDTLKFLEAKATNLPEQSPAFQKTVGTKVRRYSALMEVVQRLAEERKLNFQPNFLFPVLSSLGYMNEDMTKLCKFIVECFKSTESKKPLRLDGLAAGVIKGRFKVQLRNAICFALVRGNALAIDNQGANGITHPT